MSTATDVGASASAIDEALSLDLSVPETADCYIGLPGGYSAPDGRLHRDAEIRELTGADEEAISRAATRNGELDYARLLSVILERGLVRVGDLPASATIRSNLLVGDRDAILLAIRIATYGADYETNIVCPKCAKSSDVVFELNKDVKTHTVEDPQTTYFEVPLRQGRVAHVRLLRVADQMAAQEDDRLAVAERNTILLGLCVADIDGKKSLGAESMRLAKAGDRKKIQEWLVANSPGPRLGEVVVACPACTRESEMSLSMPALFL